MTSITETHKQSYKRAIPAADLTKVSPWQSVGAKVFGYLLVPSVLGLTFLGFSLFNGRLETAKERLLATVQQKALEISTDDVLRDRHSEVVAIYEELIDQSTTLESLAGGGNRQQLIKALEKLRQNLASGAGITGEGGSIAIVERSSEKKLLYAHSDAKSASQVSFATIPKLNRLMETIEVGKGTRSLEGSLWAYTTIGDTGWVVVAEMPEALVAASLWNTLSIALILVVLGAGGVALLFTVDLRSKLKALINACEEFEKGGNISLGSNEQRDEISQVQQAVARALQSTSLKEEKFKEQIADMIRQEERLKLRQDQEQEAEFLESEIGGLLDVVSALEDGDLTVQAEVSDRATGLVADTLNRLREQLAEVIAGVLAAAQKVADGASELEVAARTVSENVENQAQSVAKGRALTEQVAQLAQNSTAMVRKSSEALATIQATVEQGQVAINSLTEAIGVLQEGTVKIIQRMKTLGEFVGLAEQFVQDQGQIASLTQVLAINATLVAARAAEQRDPKQFIGVAREFEAIAGQVNTLATQTNDGLGILQQRTGQIQSVVSAIDAEVQGLGRLVDGFTKGVDKSQKAFNEVQAVTIEVVATGQKVSESSNEIAIAAESTARYISEIATLAEQTAALTADARTQAEIMGELAQQLLAGIRYFRLPVGLLPESK
ncbi:MAG: hypothetical protein CV045_03005 [Cyanobacteria bacterium M5B4]|nr:MAG: hypothetical protein CV045_03005 [Cyanobacteria bacterium M5B4]